MKRTTILMRRTPLRVSARLSRLRPRARPRSRTGFDLATRRLIFTRDGHACVCCGITEGQAALTVHHRRNRGMGGNTQVNTVAYGIVCCWVCNGLQETSAKRAAEARARGWKLCAGQDPTDVPVLYPDGHRYRLLPDGTRQAA